MKIKDLPVWNAVRAFPSVDRNKVRPFAYGNDPERAKSLIS
jgi:hypothetical protein